MMRASTVANKDTGLETAHRRHITGGAEEEAVEAIEEEGVVSNIPTKIKASSLSRTAHFPNLIDQWTRWRGRLEC